MSASHKKQVPQALCALRLKEFCVQFTEQTQLSLPCACVEIGDFLANLHGRFVPCPLPIVLAPFPSTWHEPLHQFSGTHVVFSTGNSAKKQVSQLEQQRFAMQARQKQNNNSHF
jgi:hypothetical protein